MLNNKDTLLYLEGLLPLHNYSFAAKSGNQQSSDSSAIASATTLDTTGHDIDLKIWTIGDYTSSELNGVAIVDDSTI